MVTACSTGSRKCPRPQGAGIIRLLENGSIATVLAIFARPINLSSIFIPVRYELD